MARNKYPEQTVERILVVATKLFLEKGYEHTSVEDILDELKDLTRGAVYHHFKTKENIFDAVATRIGESNATIFMQITQNTNLTGAEKLRAFVKVNISSETTKKIIAIVPSFFENPKFLAMQMKQMRDVITPKYIAPMVAEGVKDGSIKTNTPYELAEAIILLINVGLNPLILGGENERLYAKCMLINELLERYNITLFDDETIKQLALLKNNCSK